MSEAPQTIALSLVSHTNAGKTTLARTLLGRDVGTVRDEPHVTDAAEEYLMVETQSGDRLVLWDTPGFGDSVRLARRLEQSGNPIGRLLAEAWDRFRDRPLWSSQQAVRNVREQADVVLYLVNAAEDPQDAAYVVPEMRVLDWIGKPVIVLLNQLGAPRPTATEEEEVQRWRAHMVGARCVRGVLPLDAFARCWVQEIALFSVLEQALPPSHRPLLARLRDAWLVRRRATFDATMEELAQRLARAATDREVVPEGGLRSRLSGLEAVLRMAGKTAGALKQAAMQRLAERLDADLRASTDRIIELHALSGHDKGEILAHLAEHYAVREPVSEGKAAALGGIVTGALAGLKADLASGGMTFGAGLLIGGVLGALGAAGLARGYNLVRGTDTTVVRWSDAMLDRLAASALLAYLAVAHYGRGRGDWAQVEPPTHWQDAVRAALTDRRESFTHLWSVRDEADQAALIEALRDTIEDTTREILARLYPAAHVDAMLAARTGAKR
jgi:uncharacterized protein DUF3482/50S ribosome-binding GTPase